MRWVSRYKPSTVMQRRDVNACVALENEGTRVLALDRDSFLQQTADVYLYRLGYKDAPHGM